MNRFPQPGDWVLVKTYDGHWAIGRTAGRSVGWSCLTKVLTRHGTVQLEWPLLHNLVPFDPTEDQVAAWLIAELETI